MIPANDNLTPDSPPAPGVAQPDSVETFPSIESGEASYDPRPAILLDCELATELAIALRGYAIECIGDLFCARCTGEHSGITLRGWARVHEGELKAIADLEDQLRDGSVKTALMTPVPPRFRGRRPDNDVELEVAR